MKNIKIDTQIIEKAIADFESEVDFELVPVIVEKSTSILHVKWILSFIFILIGFSIVEVFYLMDLYGWTASAMFNLLSAVVAVSLGLGFLLGKLHFIQRFLTFKSIRDQGVEALSQRVFFLKRLYETKSNQGLLLMISLMEHRIVVKPDPRSQFAGCDELSARLVQILQQHFKQKNYQQGLLSAIEHLKTDLKPKFPKNSSGNTQNQISNKLIWWSE